MESLGPYTFIIAASVIVLLSFFFSAISKRTNIPSVLMLIMLGIGLQYLLQYLGIKDIDFFPILELLGIVGLIMIVLEATLDLRLKREKLGLIIRSIIMALLGLGGSISAAAAILFYLVPDMTWHQTLLYATPLSILSSAIVIPSVQHLPEEKEEFHIYESTFSDIIGIIWFYYLISLLDAKSSVVTGNAPSLPHWEFVINLIITVGISLVVSYLILIVFQKIQERAKLFVLISVLLLLYALAKEYHLSPLIFILIFGLTVSNANLFFRGPLKKLLHEEKFRELERDLQGLTAETAFIVRTFFFVIFGVSILLSSLVSLSVLKVSLALIGSIFIIRIILMRIVMGRGIVPQIWIAPRGLITVLLFYAIPVEYQTELFDPGILLFIILATGLVMTTGLIGYSILQDEEEDEEADPESDVPLTAKAKIKGTAFTPGVAGEDSRAKRWLAMLRYWWLTRVRNKVVRHPAYKTATTGSKRLFLTSTKALGVKPIFSGEFWKFSRRLRNIFSKSERTGSDVTRYRDYHAVKQYVHRVIFRTDTLEGILFDIIIFLLIIVSVAIVMIQSVPGIPKVWQGILLLLEWGITIVFTVEYGLRIWTSAKPKKYIFSFYGMVDLLAILPLFLELLLQNVYSLGVIRIFRLLRIFRVLKLVHYMGEANVLLRGFQVNASRIFVFLFFVVMVCTVMGALMFVIEGPQHGFSSIPRGVYWAVVTLTTVGYGDIHPTTGWGQLIAMVLMILGYGVIAVPAGLVAAGMAATRNDKQDKKRTCTHCGNENQSSESTFCSKCGNILGPVKDGP